jgi:hypothetical protein
MILNSAATVSSMAYFRFCISLAKDFEWSEAVLESFIAQSAFESNFPCLSYISDRIDYEVVVLSFRSLVILESVEDFSSAIWVVT